METFRLENESVLIEFLDLGGCITQMVNKKTDTNYVLSYQDQRLYQSNPYYFGATIGRNAGRTYPTYYMNAINMKIPLDSNEGEVHLHGGQNGLHRKLWKAKKVSDLCYRLSFKDTDSLYEPMEFWMDYRLKDNTFKIDMWGRADQPTICNLTNHSYFNLNKNKKQTIENHNLTVSPAKIQIIDDRFVPTGEYIYGANSFGKYFDFTEEKKIKSALNNGTKLSEICADGIDLAYCFSNSDFSNPKIDLTSDDGKNHLTVTTNQEACVIYTLNKIGQLIEVGQGVPVKKYQGITFEMQRKPNYVHEAEDYLTKEYHSISSYQIY
ncbi:MAG: hypothetical protein E6540_03170 [Enterococcus sp.]|nr:hypothetical protein [Enterococcus sp.]